MKNHVILFLDFDGVLHPFFPRGDRTDAENQYFSYLHDFENSIRILLQKIDIKIVISSSWRINKSLEVIKTYFTEDIQSIIIDITPEINDDEIYAGLRELEALQWLKENPIYSNWIAIDDMSIIWNSKHKLVLCDDGFRSLEIKNLTEKINDIVS